MSGKAPTKREADPDALAYSELSEKLPKGNYYLHDKLFFLIRMLETRTAHCLIWGHTKTCMYCCLGINVFITRVCNWVLTLPFNTQVPSLILDKPWKIHKGCLHFPSSVRIETKQCQVSCQILSWTNNRSHEAFLLLLSNWFTIIWLTWSFKWISGTKMKLPIPLEAEVLFPIRDHKPCKSKQDFQTASTQSR